jgi:flagellar protein FliS
MGRSDLEKKGRSIGKAVTIIESGLRASLNKDVGGHIAQSLDSLYGYMSHRLVLGGARNQTEPLEEVLRLLGELREAWSSMDTSSPAVVGRPGSASQLPERV